MFDHSVFNLSCLLPVTRASCWHLSTFWFTWFQTWSIFSSPPLRASGVKIIKGFDSRTNQFYHVGWLLAGGDCSQQNQLLAFYRLFQREMNKLPCLTITSIIIIDFARPLMNVTEYVLKIEGVDESDNKIKRLLNKTIPDAELMLVREESQEFSTLQTNEQLSSFRRNSDFDNSITTIPTGITFTNGASSNRRAL